MKGKWIILLALMLPLTGCVGQKDDPEESQEDIVLPDDTPPTTGTRFYRRVLALDFTASWCQYCPNMQEALEEAQAARPGRIVEMALHHLDDMSPAEDDALVALFKIPGYPYMVLDWDASHKFNEQSSIRFTTYVDQVLSSDQEVCGLAARSAQFGDQLYLEVKVKPASEQPCEVVAALLEDGIVASQAGYGEYYANKAVIRSFLGNGIAGTPVTEYSEGEGTVLFTAPAASALQRLVVFVLQGGKAVNVVALGLNEQKDYEYEKDAS